MADADPSAQQPEDKPEAAPEATPQPPQAPTGGSPPAAAAPKADKPAEKAAKATPTDLKSLNVRQYLEATVVAVLLKGLQEVVKQRPEDPLDFLAHFLLKHNPKKPGEAAAGSAQ